jgi:AraC-like DNA-binding protein
VWQTKRSHSEYVDRFPVRAAELVQLGRGDLGLASLEVWGVRSVIFQVRSKPDAIWTSLPDPDWVAFMLPLTWRGDYQINGWVAKPRDVFFLDGNEEFATRGAERNIAMIGIRRDALIYACADLNGTDGEDIARGNRLIEIDGPSGVRLHLLFRRMVCTAMLAGPLHGRLCMPPAHEADMISEIADWLVTDASEVTHVWFDRRDPVRIVRLAEDAARQSGFGQLSLADLCAAAGVEKSRLHQCFVEIHGVSPAQFLLKLRLSGVRERLLDRADTPLSVKDAALRFGFVSLGRFSGYYASLFGEYPHQTLERTRSDSVRCARR